jgi:hypothetical protein
MDMEVAMYEDRRRSPGQRAPWIDDPDPPMEPMTREQSKAAAAAAKAYMDAHPSDRARPADNSSSPPMKTLDQMHEAVIQGLMRNHQLSREEAEDAAENFF